MDVNGGAIVLTLEVLILSVTSVLAVGSLVTLNKLCKMIDSEANKVADMVTETVRGVSSQATGMSFPSHQAIIDSEYERDALRPFEEINPFDGLSEIREKSLSDREKRDIWGIGGN